MKKSLFAIAIATALLTSSCATIISGTNKSVTFQSNKDAQVLMNMRPVGRTNTPIAIPRRNLDNLFTIELEGCETRHIELIETFNPTIYTDVAWSWLGVGLIGMMIDYAYGVQYTTESNTDANIKCDN